ncbi:hypothetical protein B7C42_07669 [Nocardia cerradoensis]|uniref:Uncharacterized protein n=1 Tax=Nocardia cerradoensis TaxID=85688 RepID=A0A231GUD5_9NOCA|nr:hypothetical protein [Nocardia cerradoensis]OXR40244.1 hypothetical protein B7C42_07669 [Nocardia cerradoensis]
MAKTGSRSARERLGRQTAEQALVVADTYAKATLELLAGMHDSPDISPILTRLAPSFRDASSFTYADKEQLARDIGSYGHVVVNTLMDMLYAAERVFEWLQNRVVYRVHPELAASLVDTDPSAQIPCEVLRRLPHPDPFVAFPIPLLAPHSTGAMQVVAPPVYVGMLVTGLNDQLELCSTADPRLRLLSVALIGRVQPVGGEPHYPWEAIEIPCRTERFTIDEMIQMRRALRGNASEAEHTEIESNAYRLAISLLLYLCSDRQDAKSPVLVPSKRTKRRRVHGGGTVVDIGFDIGPKLFDARQAASETASESGRQVRPHIRRAHWHTYWTGPRDNPTADVRWLHPILVHSADRDRSRAVVIDADRSD